MQAWGCLAWNKYSEQTTHCPVLPFILVMMLVSGHSLWPSRISSKALQLELSDTLISKKRAQLKERSSKFAWVVKGALIFYCPGSRVKEECAWGWQYGVFMSWGEGAHGMEGLWQVQRWRRNDAGRKAVQSPSCFPMRLGGIPVSASGSPTHHPRIPQGAQPLGHHSYCSGISLRRSEF